MQQLLVLVTIISVAHGACYQPYPTKTKSGEYLLNFEKECNCEFNCSTSYCTGFFVGKLITKVEWYQKFIKNKYCNVTALGSSHVTYTCKCLPEFSGQVNFEASLKVYTVVIPTTNVSKSTLISSPENKTQGIGIPIVPKSTLIPSPQNNIQKIVIIVGASLMSSLLLIIIIVCIVGVVRCCRRQEYNDIR